MQVGRSKSSLIYMHKANQVAVKSDYCTVVNASNGTVAPLLTHQANCRQLAWDTDMGLINPLICCLPVTRKTAVGSLPYAAHVKKLSRSALRKTVGNNPSKYCFSAQNGDLDLHNRLQANGTKS